MSAATAPTPHDPVPHDPVPPEPVAPFRVAATLGRHLLSFYFPLVSTVFLLTGPHPWWGALLFMIPLDLAFRLDRRARPVVAQPEPGLPAWPFDALVYALAGVQLLNIGLLAWMYSSVSWLSLDLLMAGIVVGGSSGFSIITAHELIHRKPVAEQLLGRLLLCTVLYEHFYTEHLRGHHVRVGTEQDPATARFGETFHRFYARTVPAQFKSAWQLEKKRLGDPEMGFFDRRMLRNRILHGLAVGWGLAFSILAFAGPVAFVAFLLQAFIASRLLEAVNYFEHWGLVRRSRRVRPQDSWDTHSGFTYYGLIGLSRHADHHAYAARPYQQLRVWEEPPILPGGYIATIVMVLLANREFRQYATAELERKQLGPFAPEATTTTG
ncbi:MAG: alkane 1-monooxygenase [Myxococcota bacterium]|nr:alkane 1-monooxygenase [Myxococcota bacterium]